MSTSSRRATYFYRIARFFCLFVVVVIGSSFLIHDISLSQGFGHLNDEPTAKDYFYRLLRSGFGTLVIVFCGLGGFVILYMKREGAGGGRAPLIGIILLVVAVLLFIFRVMISSGIMGARYLDYQG